MFASWMSPGRPLRSTTAQLLLNLPHHVPSYLKYHVLATSPLRHLAAWPRGVGAEQADAKVLYRWSPDKTLTMYGKSARV